ncbi:MAG TPA: FecR domain-containing protein [Steroidobacteraceae bacterium]|jgi:transmembrane sensor
MSEILKLRTQSEIDEEAAVWAWRMDSDTVSAADRQAYRSWLRRDARHRRASEELSRVWAALDGLAEAKRHEKIATFTAAVSAARSRRVWWAAAAAVLVAAIAVSAWYRTGSEFQTLATAVGQQRNVTLADGSIVTLNTNTIVETNLRHRSREIYLRKGEAHFQVAHDRSRPFLVHAGDALVRAVGTQFEVRVRSDQHVDVVVNEGRVEVQSTPLDAERPGAGKRVRLAARSVVHALSAGQELSTTGNDYAVVPVSTHRLSSVLAWREGAVVFEGEALADAIVEIGRYTDARIIISDPQVAALRVGGRFRTGDVQEFFDALQAALPVSIRRASNGLIYIDPR